MNTTTRTVTDQEIEAFRRDGYVVIEGLLSDDELDVFEPAVSAAVVRRANGDTRGLHEKTLYEQSFQQCVNLWEDCPDVFPFTFHRGVARAAAELLRVDTLRLWHDQALYKSAGARHTDPHQDQPYWPMAETDAITAWIPLDGSSPSNGGMAYVPGSHQVGLRKFIDIFRGNPEDMLADPLVAATEPVSVSVPRGGVAFHHGLTVHLAHPNATDRMRRVHTMIYFADGATRSTDRRHISVDRDEIEIGAPIAGEVTPIVWPREHGDDPPLPSKPRFPVS